eukprot:gene1741-2401_t
MSTLSVCLSIRFVSKRTAALAYYDKAHNERNIVLDLRNKRLLNLKKDVVHKAHSWEDIIHYQKMEDDQLLASEGAERVGLPFPGGISYKLRVIYQDDMKPLCRVLTLITRWRAARALNPNTSDAGPEAAAFTKLVLYAQRPTLICGSVYPRSCVPLGDQVSSVQLVQQKIFVKVRSAGLNLELTGATEELVQLWCPEDWIDWHDAVVEAVQTELDEPPVTSPEAH